MMGHMGWAWARLLAYFYKERAIGSLSQREKSRARDRNNKAPEIPLSNSDEEREVTLEDIRQGRK